jgi:4-alpha-glucanotransferase
METPMFDWLKERGAGVLLHPSALPGSHGIGVLGHDAREWVRFLGESRIRYWQVLPLGPTGFGDSPYSTYSVFAGNPFLIDLEALAENGLLQPEELRPLEEINGERVDFAQIYLRKWPILRLAFRRFQERGLAYLPNYGIFSEYCRREEPWLRPFAAFRALKDHFGGAHWNTWEGHRSWAEAASSTLLEQLAENIEFYQFCEYLFDGQWKLLRDWASQCGVEIIGDAPIYVAGDSADVWTHPHFFQLGEDMQPTHVAGVPPDYFSETGQLWGNPLYAWDCLKEDNYRWWQDRLRRAFHHFEILRLDHFRAFESFWSIPAEAPDARGGTWVKGPGEDFFAILAAAFPQTRIIAEDLGIITDEVRQLLRNTGFPGMAILHFAFDGDPRNLYLPHNLIPNQVLYPGTHDNDTTRGWYETTPEKTRDQVRRYFRISGQEIAWDLIRATYAAPSKMCIIAAQDLLNLDSFARMNIPGSPQGNWNWRMHREQQQQLWQSRDYLRELAWLYGRA